jgi:hypothetical protein
MSSQQDIERTLDGWLAEGPTEINDRIVESALDQIEHTSQRRALRVPSWGRLAPAPFRLAGIALIAVALVGTALVFLRPAPAAVVGTSPSPMTLISPAPTASPLPTAAYVTPSPGAGGLTLLGGAPTSEGITYYSDVFTPKFTIQPGAGWWLTNNAPTLASLDKGPNEPSPPATYTVQLLRPDRVVPAGNSTPIAVPSDLIAWLEARSDLRLSAPAPVTVGGIKGTMVEGVLRAGAAVNPDGGVNLICTAESICGYRGGMLISIAPERHLEIIVLTVRGARVVIGLAGPAANSTADRAMLDAALNTLAFPSH